MRDSEYEALRREYAGLASRYDTRWKRYLERTTRETLSRLRVAPDDRVLDVGCGTGLLLEWLSLTAPRARLAGVDLSGEMLDVARRRLGPAVELERTRAEALPFDEATFDVVVSTSALHFIRHPVEALREMRRVLKPAGRVVITDWCNDYLTCRICDMLLRAFNRGHFRAYGTEECRELLLRAGFTDVDVERYKIDWLWGLMTAVAVGESGR